MVSQRRKVAAPTPPIAAEVRREFETFTPLSRYDETHMIRNAPACWNGNVTVRKYRVTVELVDEPIETIHARIIGLWERTNSHHDRDPLRREAARYGLDLTPYVCGSKATRRG